MQQLELFSQETATVAEYDLQGLFQDLNRKHWKGMLPEYRCEWSGRMITTWGSCHPHKKVIRVSRLFQNRPLPELLALLCHEMIHIKYRGHGKRFRSELARVGLAGDIERQFPHLSKLTRSIRRPLRYTYECSHCHLRIQRRKRIRGFCVSCHNAGVSARFKLLPK